MHAPVQQHYRNEVRTQHQPGSFPRQPVQQQGSQHAQYDESIADRALNLLAGGIGIGHHGASGSLSFALTPFLVFAVTTCSTGGSGNSCKPDRISRWRWLSTPATGKQVMRANG